MVLRPTACAVALCLGLPAFAAEGFPLMLRNCGVEARFDAAPESVVTVGQAATEALYALGLADKVIGTLVWFTE